MYQLRLLVRNPQLMIIYGCSFQLYRQTLLIDYIFVDIGVEYFISSLYISSTLTMNAIKYRLIL